jgi:glyoxylase-like metal-dependent hydrolase (beta-lactamase superfamily II)
MTQLTTMQTPLAGLHASTPQPLSFAPRHHVRAFLLRRPAGNILLYSTTELASDRPAIEDLGRVARRYLNHWHEAMFPSDIFSAPLFVHADEREHVQEAYRVRGTFTRRHTIDGDFEAIPTPGHTPGATAYLWDSGERRMLFTGDTLYLDHGEWIAAVLESSDRAAYLESLALVRDLDFDVLVPWAASAGDDYVSVVEPAEARRRIDAIIDRLRRGGNR